MSTFPLHPAEIGPGIQEVMMTVIIGGDLPDVVDVAHTRMEHQNPLLREQLARLASSSFGFELDEVVDPVTTEVQQAFRQSSGLAYSTMSIALDGFVPTLTQSFIDDAMERRLPATLPEHEWHRELHANTVLRSILSLANGLEHRPNLRVQNATFSSGGLVSYLVNGFVARLN